MNKNTNKDLKIPHHNKIKNTGILFEALTRQITRDILDKKDISPAINIIQKYFKENTELRKELKLYKYLLETKFTNELKASNYLDIILEFRKSINNINLKREKYNIIKEIKETYTIDEFFSWRIKDYPIYATIYKLFEYRNSNLNNNLIVESFVNEKSNIVDFMLKKHKTINKNQPNLVEKLYNSQDKDIKKISYKIIIEKFNKKYSGVLNKDQKLLVKNYINNLSNTKSLQKYVTGIIPEIVSELIKVKKNINDKVVIIKLGEVKNQLNKIKKLSIIEDKHIVGLLKIYQLLEEINKHKNLCKEKTNVKKQL